MPFADADRKRSYQRQRAQRPDVKEKRAAYAREYGIRNAGKKAAAEAVRKMERRGQLLVTNARMRAKKRGLVFDLDGHVHDIQSRIDAGSCELTGYPFNLSGGRTFDSPSIDRIDASKGYTHDNVRIVLHMVNAAMGDWGDGPLRQVMMHWLTGNAINPHQAAHFIKASIEAIADQESAERIGEAA